MSKAAEALLALANAIENGPSEIDKAFVLSRVEKQWVVNALRYKASNLLISENMKNTLTET
jgi:hypothetical protein